MKYLFSIFILALFSCEKSGTYTCIKSHESKYYTYYGRTWHEMKQTICDEYQYKAPVGDNIEDENNVEEIGSDTLVEHWDCQSLN